MANTPLKLPKDLASFLQGKSAADIQKLEDSINALMDLQVNVAISGTTQVVSTRVQISGDSAVINIQL